MFFKEFPVDTVKKVGERKKRSKGQTWISGSLFSVGFLMMIMEPKDGYFWPGVLLPITGIILISIGTFKAPED